MLKFLRRAAAAAALLLSPAAYAQAPKAPTDADPALWVVRDKDTTLYLFGTVHVLKPGMTWFDEAVKDAFDASDEVVLELADPTGPETMAAVLKLGMTTSGPTLSEKLSDEQRAHFTPAIEKLELPAAVFDRQKPWMAAVTLQMFPLLKLGYDPAVGPETVLISAAKKAGKPVSGLETPEEQLRYLDNMPEKEQLAFLGSTLEHLPKVGEETAKMVTIWAKGDDKGIGRMMAAGTDSKVVTEALLTARNRRWADWIDKRMAKPGTVFVAVGAGHLAGKHSVQSFLKQYRLKAKRIKY